MAKQYGIHKIGGKVDGQSYYYSKNGGFVSRKINPGMSARVKEGKEYANTRLNNAEFGAAGSLAGAMVGTVSQRWRYILDSIATGKLVKVIKAAMMQDTTNPWGQRTVPLAEMAGIQEAYNRFSKNDVPQEILDKLSSNFIYDANTKALSLQGDTEMSLDTAEELLAKGADYISVKTFFFSILNPAISADGKTYESVQTLLVPVPSLTGSTHVPVEEDALLINGGVLENAPAFINDETHFGGMLVVVTPERKVGDKYYTLQELCSACYVAAQEGTVEP